MKDESANKCVVTLVLPNVSEGEIVHYECELHIGTNVIQYVVLVRRILGTTDRTEIVIRLISDNPREILTAAAVLYLFRLTGEVVSTTEPVDIGLKDRREKHIPADSLFTGVVSCGPLDV